MAGNKTENDLRRVERAMNKLKRKVKRSDLDYNVQFSVNAMKPSAVIYSAQMTPLAVNLRPATFISHVSVDDLVAQIEGFTNNLDWDKMEEAYHKGQINSAEHTIEGHKEALEELKNKDKEEVSDEQLEIDKSSTPETDQTNK
jgi:hypothetical protein